MAKILCRRNYEASYQRGAQRSLGASAGASKGNSENALKYRNDVVET